MKSLFRTVLLVAFVDSMVALPTAVFAAENASPAAVEPAPAGPPLNQIAERLQRFEGSRAAFEVEAGNAIKAGMPFGDVMPLRCMYGLRMNDLKLLEEIVAAPGDFGRRNEGAFLLEVAQGVLAVEKGDFAAMEAHYKQAFWDAPELGEVLATFVKRGKDQQRIASVVVPMERKLALSQGGETTLAALAQGKKAVLLDFWASWCGPCMASMPELKRRSEFLPPQGVAVAGVNTESDAAKAEQTRAKKSLGEIPWLLDAETASLSELLGIDTIPCAVLVSPEGKILAKIHPEDPKLAVALGKLGVTLAANSAETKKP